MLSTSKKWDSASAREKETQKVMPPPAKNVNGVGKKSAHKPMMRKDA